MKKIAILLLLLTLSDSSFAQSQLLVNAHAQNDRGDRIAVVEPTEAFLPDRQTGAQQNFSWSEMKTPGNYPSSVSPTGYECSSGLITKKKGFTPQSLPQINMQADSIECYYLFGRGYLLESNNIEPDAYDTLRLFMEQCPLWSDGVTLGSDGFRYIDGAVSGWSAGGTGRWNDFLTWLKQVLYLNPDTIWYCQDVYDMITALQNNQTAKLAAIQYVIQSGKCPGFDTGLYHSVARNRHTNWMDSVEQKYSYLKNGTISGFNAYNDSIKADTLAHPYDTTVPSVAQVGAPDSPGPAIRRCAAQLSNNFSGSAFRTASGKPHEG